MNKLSNGRLLVAIGVIHTVFGIAAGVGWAGPSPGRNLFSEIAGAGLVGAIDPDPWRMTVFWFLWFGFMTMVLGQVMHTLERGGHELPRAVAWSLGAIGLGGVLLMPASGFWTALLVAVRIWWRGRPTAVRKNQEHDLSARPEVTA